ncbi:MAG: hypothetical protein NUV80_01020 [Candidatus Berkelbacteria bacterium]|nr:hypothetical protein [Candidatus Berkelbacteria bacterium]
MKTQHKMPDKTKLIILGIIVAVIVVGFSLVREGEPKELGDSVNSRFTNGSALVGTSSAEVLAANSARDWVHLSNCDGHVNFFAVEDTAVLDKGIVLGATTGTDVDIFGTHAAGKISGISGEAGGKVCYTTRP